MTMVTVPFTPPTPSGSNNATNGVPELVVCGDRCDDDSMRQKMQPNSTGRINTPMTSRIGVETEVVVLCSTTSTSSAPELDIAVAADADVAISNVSKTTLPNANADESMSRSSSKISFITGAAIPLSRRMIKARSIDVMQSDDNAAKFNVALPFLQRAGPQCGNPHGCWRPACV